MAEKLDLPSLDMATLASSIEAYRLRYIEAREVLVGVLTRVQQNPHDAVGALLDHAEEYGSADALDAMQRDPGIFGEPRDNQPMTEEQRAEIEARAEAVLEAQDDLDRATAERETRAIKANPSRRRVVNVGGREFTVDADKQQLRANDGGRETHGFDMTLRGGRELSLSEELRLRADVERVEPREQHGRDRIR